MFIPYFMHKFTNKDFKIYHVQTPAHPQTYPYAMNMKENYTMKSPDSGYHEPCLSPTEQHNAMVCKDFLFYLRVCT
jgi:hypothetical protein